MVRRCMFRWCIITVHILYISIKTRMKSMKNYTPWELYVVMDYLLKKRELMDVFSCRWSTALFKCLDIHYMRDHITLVHILITKNCEIYRNPIKTWIWSHLTHEKNYPVQRSSFWRMDILSLFAFLNAL